MKLVIATVMVPITLVRAMASPAAAPRGLVNHIGYDARGSKKLIVQSAKATGFDAFQARRKWTSS